MSTPVHPGYWIAIAVLLSATVLLLALPGLDQALFYALNNELGSGATAVWANLSNLGDGLVATVLGIAIFCRVPHRLVLVFVAVIVVGLLANVGKEVFNALPAFDSLQSRPAGRLGLVCGAEVVENCVHVIGKALRHYSFPSGHSAAAATVATLICLTVAAMGWRIAVVIVFSLAAISRVVVGAHWPVDVTAGAMLGVAGTLFSTWLVDRYVPEPGKRARLGLYLFAAAVSVALFFNDQDYESFPGVNLVENSLATIGLLVCLWQLWQWRRECR